MEINNNNRDYPAIDKWIKALVRELGVMVTVSTKSWPGSAQKDLVET